MRTRAISLAILATLGLAAGLSACGDDDGSTTDAIQETLSQLEDPGQRCELLTDGLLSDTYGGSSTRALATCERDVRDETATFAESEILEVEDACARVSAVDSEGRRAVLVLIETTDGWRVDEIADGATPDAREAQC